MVLTDTRNNYYFYKDRLKQLKRYLHFCDPNVPVPVVKDSAFDMIDCTKLSQLSLFCKRSLKLCIILVRKYKLMKT